LSKKRRHVLKNFGIKLSARISSLARSFGSKMNSSLMSSPDQTALVGEGAERER
jgi:hypothetical protein